MRISTGLRAAMIPAVLLGLAACSDTPEAPESPAATADSATQDARTQGTSTQESSTEEQTQGTETSSESANFDPYTEWSGITECPTLDEVIAATGITFVGEVAEYDPATSMLACSYGDPQVAGTAAARIQVQSGLEATTLDAPELTDFVSEGVPGGVIPAPQYGDAAWYLYADEDPQMESPTVCLLGGSGTNMDGENVNIAVLIGDPASSDAQGLCDAVDSLAAIG